MMRVSILSVLLPSTLQLYARVFGIFTLLLVNFGPSEDVVNLVKNTPSYFLLLSIFTALTPPFCLFY